MDSQIFHGYICVFLFTAAEALWFWVLRFGPSEGAAATKAGDLRSHEQNFAAPSQRAARISGTMLANYLGSTDKKHYDLQKKEIFQPVLTSKTEDEEPDNKSWIKSLVWLVFRLRLRTRFVKLASFSLQLSMN